MLRHEVEIGMEVIVKHKREDHDIMYSNNMVGVVDGINHFAEDTICWVHFYDENIDLMIYVDELEENIKIGGTCID